MQDVRPDARGTPCARTWALAALLAFAVALGVLYHELLTSDPRQVVAAVDPRHPESRAGAKAFGAPFGYGDYRWTIWAYGRNSYTLATRPWRLFDAEPCFPMENALALGHPLATPGLLGVPAWLASREPILAYNASVVILLILSALAMYAVVVEWTAQPVAGIVAGVAFVFQKERLLDVEHPFVHDTAWTVLALLFAHRWFRRGGWRYALATAACVCAQIANNFYSTLATLIALAAFLPWLLWAYGRRHLRPWPVLAALLLVGTQALLLLQPYLAMRDQGTIGFRAHLYAPWSFFLPGGRFSTGWVALALALAALALPRRRSLAPIPGDPRWAILAMVLIGLLLATGGNAFAVITTRAMGNEPDFVLPNLYAFLAAAIPGLEVIRNPSLLSNVPHLGISLLAGIGAAGLLRLLPTRRRPWLAGILVSAVCVELLFPAAVGLGPSIRYGPVAVSPDQEAIRFFRELEDRGNRGPVLELPVRRDVRFLVREETERVLLSAYHHRRTSACYNSFVPESVTAVDAAIRKLPSDAGVTELRALGFTTILVHAPLQTERGATAGSRLLHVLEAEARRPDGSLTRILANDLMTAYALDVPPAPVVE